MSNAQSETEIPPPPFVLAGMRCALEMLLVGLAIGLVGLPAENALSLAVVVVLAVVAMVVVLFWGLNRQMDRWIRHAQGKPTFEGDGWL